jgi:hypothetical protein
VSASDFFFSIDLSGQPPPNDMFRELVSRILGQAGCAPQDVPAVVDALHTVVTASASKGDRSCRLTFVAGNGGLDIAVSSSAGRVYHATHPIG